MWLFTIHGFYSIVQKEQDFHIRSRSKQDLVNLKKLTGIKKPVAKSYPGSDYPWRLIVSRVEKDLAVVALGTDIEYGNFKSAVAATSDQAGKLHAYHQVWHAMAQTADDK